MRYSIDLLYKVLIAIVALLIIMLEMIDSFEVFIFKLITVNGNTGGINNTSIGWFNGLIENIGQV